MHQDNSTFKAIRERFSSHRFSNKSVADSLLFELLDLANRTPSGFNLQPWHFILVRDETVKKVLCHIAMDQKQVLEAPATVVFVANPQTWQTKYPSMISTAVKDGLMTENHAKNYLKSIEILFKIGTLGIYALYKKVLTPLYRLRKPTPTLITSETGAKHYVREQTMLAVSTFMIAAKSAGLDTCPMEGFDEERLKKLLAIPAVMTVPVIVAVGYAEESAERKESVRVALDKVVSLERYPNLLENNSLKK
jgi:nitroreductase